MNLQEEARKIVLDNLSADEETPWFGYAASMEKQLIIKTGCSRVVAFHTIAEASKPHTLTLGQVANRIIDLEEALSNMLSLALDLTGPDAEKYEAYITSRNVLTQRLSNER